MEVRALEPGRSPGEGNGNPRQCSCLKIPCTEEPGGLQDSQGSDKTERAHTHTHTHTMKIRDSTQNTSGKSQVEI